MGPGCFQGRSCVGSSSCCARLRAFAPRARRRISAAQDAAPSAPLQILPPTISQDLRIVWEVKNRFRLFRREADFLPPCGGAEPQDRARAPNSRWRPRPTAAAGRARMLSNLCVDLMGALMTTCERDGARESYLAPTDHRVEMRLDRSGAADDLRVGVRRGRRAAAQLHRPVRRGGAHSPCSTASRPIVTVDVAMPDGPPLRATDRDRGARSADRGARRLGRGGRGQSGPAGRALGRGLLLSPLRHGQRVLSPRPRHLQRRPHLRAPSAARRTNSPNGRGSARAG